MQYGIQSVKKLVILVLMLCSAAAVARTAYVTDELKITMRTGESTGHRIIKMLSTGDKVNILSSNSATGYSKVRTDNGSEGFVLTSQLVDEPVARQQLAAAVAEVQALKAAPGELRSRLATLSDEHKALTASYEQLKQDKTVVDQEYAALQRTAVKAAFQGAAELKTYFGKLESVAKKGRTDLVTQADLASESKILETIRSRFPDHAILAEESGRSGGESAIRWVIDPLDGTLNFVRGFSFAAIAASARPKRR